MDHGQWTIKNNKKIKKIFSVLLVFLFFINFFTGYPSGVKTARADTPWYDADWAGRFKITPNAVNSDLYYDLSLAPADFWSKVRSDGGDIRVTTQDGVTQIPREVSGFDYAGNKGSLFIGASGTDTIKVTTSGAGGDWPSPVIAVTAGQNYVLSMDVKWVSGSCPFLGLAYDGGGVNWIMGRISSGAVINIDTVSTDWQHLEYSFTMPAVSSARMSIEAYSGEAKSDPGNTEVHFKNIALTKGVTYGLGSGFAGWTNPGNQGNLFTDETAFYVYYGNAGATEPAAGSTYGKYNAWESAAKLVAHMEDANDSTVNQNNGTIANAYPVTADAKVNKGYQYNAANYNYITIGDKASLDFTTGFTIGGWIYKSGDFVDGAILGKINAGGPFNGYMLWTGQSVNGVTLYIDQGGRISTGALSDNAWHRIIATWNGAQLNMYADGTPVTPVNYNVAPTSSGKSFIIGGYSYAALNNLLDEAIVYDRPWSAQEVATDYADQNDPASFWTTGNQGLSNDNQTITVSGTVDPVITMNVGALAAGTPCDGTFTGNGGTVALGTLTPGAVASSDANSVAHICVRVSANPYYGLIGLVSSANGALVSTGTPGNIIPSATATLVPGTAGYGACVAAPSGADSGSATWAGDTPYASGSCDSTHHSVGRLQTTAQQFMHANGPVQNLYLTGYVKAAVSGTIAAHNDYADTLSFVVSGTF